MASLINEGNGRRRIEFVNGNKRPKIRLGKISERHARPILHHVEELIASKATGNAMAHDTADWLGQIKDELVDKLAHVGLIEAREKAILGPFLDGYIEKRKADLKPLTLKKLDTTRDYLVEFFGYYEKPLREITEGDADDWRLYLLAGKVAKGKGKAKRHRRGENTVRKHAQVAKQFFNAAVRSRLIRTNPFAHLPATVRPNHERVFFVTAKNAYSVLDSCPDSEWRLIFALSRFGGLRCPSEHLTLRWQDIDWDLGRIRVKSPKTEHHEGKESRLVPIYPELRPYLEEAWDLAEPGAEFVIGSYRNTEANLRTRMRRIIERAGLDPWPKIFQNLRSSRQTELEETFPSHVVCAWMGNSESVAKKHYLQVTDEHFERAIVPSSTEVAQKAAHQMRADHAQTETDKIAAHEKPLVVQGDALICEDAQNEKVAEEGLEPPTRGL